MTDPFDALTACMIFTPAEASTLPVGQWVIDADGYQRCLVNTNVGWPQLMFMSNGASTYVAIDYVTYPLRLADVTEQCPHAWGTQECGHCRSCGEVIAEPRTQTWTILGLEVPGQ